MATTTATDYANEYALRRKMAYALMMQGMSAEPVQHWTQGAARLAQALFGGYQLGQVGADERKEREEYVKSAPGLGGVAPMAAAAAKPGGTGPTQQAFLTALAGGEAPSYNTLYGGGQFKTWPNIRVRIFR